MGINIKNRILCLYINAMEDVKNETYFCIAFFDFDGPLCGYCMSGK
jgi:hypothetical protein